MNIDKLKSVISGRGGVAVPNRFRVIVTPPPAVLSEGVTRDLEILCENLADLILLYLFCIYQIN